jgi:glutamate/tyrosine decarboxylase-like PLP-dependent enzyme
VSAGPFDADSSTEELTCSTTNEPARPAGKKASNQINTTSGRSRCARSAMRRESIAISTPSSDSSGGARRYPLKGLLFFELVGAMAVRDKGGKDKSAWAVREAARLAEDFMARETNLPKRGRPPEELVSRLGIELGSAGLSLAEVSDKLRGVLRATPSAASPRFLNQLFGGRDEAATLAEMLVPLSNTSMYTYKVGGAQILVEREVLRRMVGAVPYPDGEGVFSPGGSLANLTAMVLARNEILPQSRDDGIQDQRPTVYTSSESHYSIRKAAGILGIGRNAVRVISSDESGAMRVAELADVIDDDRHRGFKPFFINATAGTTVLGAIDPLPEIAVIAREQAIWLHVDAALGGSLLLSSRYRHLLDGAAESSSLAWNAHKLMSVPLPCSVLLVRRRGLLQEHLGEAAAYLFQADEADLNPGTRSIQCGRRNDALKLWAAWQYHGDSGFDRRMTRLVELAHRAAELVDRDPDLELLCRPRTVNVCFRVRGFDSAEICAHLDRRSILKIGHGAALGVSAIRLVCIDPELDETRIRTIIRQIKRAAREMRRGSEGPGQKSHDSV